MSPHFNKYLVTKYVPLKEKKICGPQIWSDKTIREPAFEITAR